MLRLGGRRELKGKVALGSRKVGRQAAHQLKTSAGGEVRDIGVVSWVAGVAREVVRERIRRPVKRKRRRKRLRRMRWRRIGLISQFLVQILSKSELRGRKGM